MLLEFRILIALFNTIIISIRYVCHRVFYIEYTMKITSILL